MNFELAECLIATDQRHSHLVDDFTYAVAAQEAKLLDEYVLLHLVKPWWMPALLFKWLVGRFVVLSRFKTK